MKVVVLAFLLLPAAAVEAQVSPPAESNIPPPRAPWIAPAPERGRWMVRISDSPAKTRRDAEGNPVVPQGVNRRPLQIESTTWNDVKRDVFSFTDGSRTTVFYYAGFALVEGQSSEGNPAPVLVQQLPGTDFSTLRSAGWLGFDWVAKPYFVQSGEYRPSHQTAPAEPVMCHIYRKPEGPVAGGDAWLPEMTAWIRANDMQPVCLTVGPRTFEFVRLDPPTTAPEMTREQAARLLSLKDQNTRMDRLRERSRRLRGE